ncbi:hypothetical protein [Pandoraea anhela]|uniref:hypothetical protein n=1 Tax=Pandoraea anhela TaxID=2508295 RepID=UPI001241A996|nr:hypothetical protein [Pandoraea anhela]
MKSGKGERQFKPGWPDVIPRPGSRSAPRLLRPMLNCCFFPDARVTAMRTCCRKSTGKRVKLHALPRFGMAPPIQDIAALARRVVTKPQRIGRDAHIDVDRRNKKIHVKLRAMQP